MHVFVSIDYLFKETLYKYPTQWVIVSGWKELSKLYCERFSGKSATTCVVFYVGSSPIQYMYF